MLAGEITCPGDFAVDKARQKRPCAERAVQQRLTRAARLIGGRLAIQLAAPKLGRRMHLVAFRATPAHPEAVYYHARYWMERFGPLATWQFMRDHPDWTDAPPDLHADWVALSGFIAARLRDFDRAERLLNRAETISPDRPWPCIERASAYEFAERLEPCPDLRFEDLVARPRLRIDHDQGLGHQSPPKTLLRPSEGKTKRYQARPGFRQGQIGGVNANKRE